MSFELTGKIVKRGRKKERRPTNASEIGMV